jgi:hypothetical protein
LVSNFLMFCSMVLENKLSIYIYIYIFWMII